MLAGLLLAADVHDEDDNSDSDFDGRNLLDKEEKNIKIVSFISQIIIP